MKSMVKKTSDHYVVNLDGHGLFSLSLESL